jgi:hypothetical protein
MQNKTSENPSYVISYMTIRKAIGFLGILLPAILLLGNFTLGKCHSIENSISHYYYTTMGDVFVGILCAVALFLIAYKGYDKLDGRACNLAGICALGIAFFPTEVDANSNCNNIQIANAMNLSVVHYISAALFFTTLALISLFLFTKTGNAENISIQKVKRNRIYKVCGVIMLTSIVLIACVGFIPAIGSKLQDYKPVFVLEWIALIAFGVSWLVKGELVLGDKG